MAEQVTVYVEHDEGMEWEEELVEIKSFNRRHGNYADPDQYDLLISEDGVSSSQIGLRRKLDVGTAFILSCYQHGGVSWSLKGEGMQCRWDTAPVAGILFLDKSLAKTHEEREKRARSVLEAYNEWCNGEVYHLSTKDEEGEMAGSCGWVLASGVKDVARDLAGHDNYKLEGCGF